MRSAQEVGMDLVGEFRADMVTCQMYILRFNEEYDLDETAEDRIVTCSSIALLARSIGHWAIPKRRFTVTLS